MTKLLSSLSIAIFVGNVVGCATKPQPLPEGGPTTKQIVHGQHGQVDADSENAGMASGTFAHALSAGVTMPSSMSSQTTARLKELNQDFKQVPNPQILGYVAPHFNQANMPVPGYFTVFHLYKQNGYALMSEDAATGVSQ